MFLGWDRDFRRHQGKHAEQTVLSCMAGYQCQVRRGWLCFLLPVCLRMEDSKPWTLFRGIYLRLAGERYSAIEMGSLRKWQGTDLGRKHFKTSGVNVFSHSCPVSDINLLGEFFALSWSTRQDLPRCSFNRFNKKQFHCRASEVIRLMYRAMGKGL